MIRLFYIFENEEGWTLWKGWHIDYLLFVSYKRINNNRQLMEKEERRQNYVNKSNHQRKEKKDRKESSLVNQDLIQRIKCFELKDIISFMNQQYEKITNRQKEIENQLNIALIKRIQELKTSWLTFHRQRLISFLQKHQLPFKNDPKVNLQTIVHPLWKKDYYGWNYNLFPRKNKNNGQIKITQIFIYYPVNTKDAFFLQEFDESIDFRIDFKRMMKDTIYLCTNFNELVEDVEKQLKIKWPQK